MRTLYAIVCLVLAAAPTGADGAFALTLPLDDAPFMVRAFAGNGETSLLSEEVAVLPDDLGTDRLRLVLAPLPKK